MLGQARLQFFVVDVQMQFAGVGIQLDPVTVAYRRQRPAGCCLRRHVEHTVP